MAKLSNINPLTADNIVEYLDSMKDQNNGKDFNCILELVVCGASGSLIGRLCHRHESTGNNWKKLVKQWLKNN